MIPTPSRTASQQAGEAARKRLPPGRLGDWTAAADRPDPVDLLVSQETDRIADLVPVRYGRMSVSPLTFYRGAALPMASDLAAGSNSGIVTQICGDAHLSNFGLFASPERDLVFDINDFDETLHGPFEFDLKRLAASLVVAGRSRGFSVHQNRHAVHRAIRSYQMRMAGYAPMRAIDVHYARVDANEVLGAVKKGARSFIESTVHASAHHDALHALPKLTEVVDGRRRIIDHPPIIVHRDDVSTSMFSVALSSYLGTLQEDRRELVKRYTVEDYAMKVVGVGSVGLGAFAVLLIDGPDDPLFIQLKQAVASVYEAYLTPSNRPSSGERVVIGQRRLQAVSDILLGWVVGEQGRHWYVRQLQDQKAGAMIEEMSIDDLTAWGELCAWALARGHARSGEPSAIAVYLGEDEAFRDAMTSFAEAYADQTERDFATFSQAIATGRIAAQTGV
jgi:uncharacterized protein (DUF2252 family)